MTPDLDKLAALAGAATRGPWVAQSLETPGHQPGWYIDTHGFEDGPEPVWVPPQYPVSEADAAYIAAASPSVVLALIERVRAAEALLRERAAMEYDIADDADRAAEAEFLRPIGGGL